MTTNHHTNVAAEDSGTRELLARLLKWKTNGFGRHLNEPIDDVLSKGDFGRTIALGLPYFETCPTSMSPSFDMVVVYEDVVAAKRAKEVCDRLRFCIGEGFTFEMHLWRFDVLRTPELRATAIKDAAGSRLIVIASRGRGELPAETKIWIEYWMMQRRARPGALVLLVEAAEELTSLRTIPQFTYLQEVAGRARMEFFASMSKPAIGAKHTL